MATFDEHIAQAIRNLSFLTETNSKNNSFWDWQVTASFYTAVHIVNAHLAVAGDLHYRTHEDVKNALNPHNAMAVCKIEQDAYLAYTKLEMLSRRARYLCHENKENKDESVHFTYDKHFAKALRNLDKILSFFKEKYDITYPRVDVECQDLSPAENLKIFKIKSAK